MVARAIERPATGRPLCHVGRISARSRPCRSPQACPPPVRCSRSRQPGSPIRNRRPGRPCRCSRQSRRCPGCMCSRPRRCRSRCRCTSLLRMCSRPCRGCRPCRCSHPRRCSRRCRRCRACRCSRRRRCSLPCIRTEEQRYHPVRTGRCPRPPEARIREPPALSPPSGTSSHLLLSVRSGPSPGHRQLLLFW